MHVTQYFLPWLGYQEFYLAREQQRRGHSVRVVSSNLRWTNTRYSALRSRGGPEVTPVGETLEFEIPTTRLRVRANVKGRLFLVGLDDAVRAFEPDIVHAHGYLQPATLRLAQIRRNGGGFRLLVDEHQLPYQAEMSLLHVTARRVAGLLARRYVLPTVEELVAVAEGARTWMSQEYACPLSRIRFIPLGADTDVFRPDEAARERVRATLGVGPSQSVVMYSGKVANHKRIDLLVKAIAQLRARSSVVLLVVGDAESATLESLTELAHRSGVSMRVVPAVTPTELAAYFNAADVCAWPADCTVSHLEAASCGRPIIIPDEAGIEDRVAAGNGLRVPVGDVIGLASAVERLLDDADLRSEMGKRGRLIAEAEYSWRLVARRFEDLYDSMLGRVQ